jgi:hypothetical protein
MKEKKLQSCNDKAGRSFSETTTVQGFWRRGKPTTREQGIWTCDPTSQDGTLEVLHKKTEEMVADIFTKPLGAVKFKLFRDYLLDPTRENDCTLIYY